MKTGLVGVMAGMVLGAGLMFWKDRSEWAALRAEVDRLGKAPAAVPAPPAAMATTVPIAAPQTIEKIVKVPAPEDHATRQEMIRLLDEKNARIAAGEAAQRELREKLSDFETRLAQTKAENEQLTASQKEMKEQLDTATRLAESMRDLTRGREERLAQTEVSNQDLRKRSEEAVRKLAKLGELTTQMDDVGRRREVYLNNVLRRYREATELFRALALRLDNPDLSRIQQTITAADEDLRQIQALNAQSTRIQKDLALARK
jgi:hypothetical protein